MKMTKKFDKLNETFNVDSDIVSIDVESENVTEKIEKVALVIDDVKKDHGAEEKAGPGQEVEEEEGKLFKLKQKFYLKISIIFY